MSAESSPFRAPRQPRPSADADRPDRADVVCAVGPLGRARRELLKDAGCSSNAGRVFQLFGGPEHATKRAVWLRDWRRLSEQVRYALEAVEPGGSLPSRSQRLVGLGIAGQQASRELFEIRCDRGAEIARALGCSEGTARGVLTMDEHWDGGGHPRGLRHDAIPLAGRIIGLAQVVEIFGGLDGGEPDSLHPAS